MTSPLATQPIAGASPSGQSARYEPEFEKLQAEIQKLENPAGGEVKWADVQELAQQLLAKKSKDLLVASYYAVARLQREGFAGLNQGLGVLVGLCSNFWDTLWPEMKRMRARESALEWLIDRVNRQLEADASADPAELRACAETMNQLANLVNGKLESPNPSLDGLVRALSGKASASSTPESAGGATVVQPGAAPAQGGPVGPISNRKQAFERLKEVAEFLRRTEPHSPVSYLVQRAVKWGDMRLEDVLTELVKDDGVRRNLFETLGVKEEKKD
ncbi:MAG: type VI secretion system ImpA family N-terminal domain-containing protein [Planctomycetes bacterium]|nr:type VI secretion system ImpA family N-terminal domain-containing protein [Planctomycetota bacterium]